MRSGTPQCCPLSRFLFGFFTVVVMAMAMFSCVSIGISITSTRKLTGLGHAKESMLRNEDPGRLHVILDCLNDSVCLV